MYKRVLITVTNDIIYDQRMQKTAHSLVSLGMDVTILGRKKKHSKPISDLPFHTKRFQLLFQKGLWFYLEYNLRLFIYILFSKKYDILCSVDLDTILPAVLTKKIKSFYHIYDAHEYFTEVPELVGREKKKKIWKWIERFSIPKCDIMYTVNESLSDMFKSEYHRTCEVIYNYPLEYTINDIEKESTFTLIYQGDLNIGRGVDIAIESMIELDAQLWIVGDGLMRDTLEAKVDELNLRDKVIFFGYKRPEELRIITAKAHVGINVLENKGMNYYYSLANKFFDYIQALTVPINSDFPEYRRIQDKYNCAVLVSSYSTVELIEAVNTCKLNQNSYQKLVKNCDIAKPFLVWEHQERKLSSIYKNV